MPSAVLAGDSLYPATIDYLDGRLGMTFLAGHTLPTRVFDYSRQARSRYDRPLAQLPVEEMPHAIGARVLRGSIQFTIAAPRDMPYALAFVERRVAPAFDTRHGDRRRPRRRRRPGTIASGSANDYAALRGLLDKRSTVRYITCRAMGRRIEQTV